MSMISAQIDELRKLATRYDELQVGAVKAVTMPSDMGSTLRDAADTIWQLRDYLQRVNAENAKLRQAFSETLARLIAANEVTVSNYMDDEYCNLLRELGIEVGE